MRSMKHEACRMQDGQARSVLEACGYAVLATINADDGSPYCIPVSPVLWGDALYFHCGLTGKKLENLSRDNRVCLTCVGATRPLPEQFTLAYESVVVTGRAELVEDGEEKLEILRRICEKYAPSNLDAYPRVGPAALPRLSICRIAIEDLCGKRRGGLVK